MVAHLLLFTTFRWFIWHQSLTSSLTPQADDSKIQVLIYIQYVLELHYLRVDGVWIFYIQTYMNVHWYKKNWCIDLILEPCIPDYNDPVFVCPCPAQLTLCPVFVFMIVNASHRHSHHRPHLINRIVPGSSKPARVSWGPVKSTEHCIENPRQPHSIPDCLNSLILANVTQAHLKLWPLQQGYGLQTLLGWLKAQRGWQATICPVFCPPSPPPTLLKVERATDRRQIFVVCRHCKSRPACHTTSERHHRDPGATTQPRVDKLDVLQNSR